jgi:hypothetical protein
MPQCLTAPIAEDLIPHDTMPILVGQYSKQQSRDHL